MNKFSRFFSVRRFFKKGRKRYTLTVMAIAVIILYSLFGRGGSTSNIQSAVAANGNILEKVSVTGQVLPIGKADLSFEKGGVVASIRVKIGDEVKKGAVIASLDSSVDQASLDSAKAKLADVTRGLRPEELQVDQAKVASAEVALNNANQDAVSAFRQGYVQAQGAVNNYADVFFLNPQTINPTITIQTQSQNFQNSINAERVTVSGALSSWKTDIDTATGTVNLNAAVGYLNVVKHFISDLSVAVNALSPGSSGLSQTAINAYVLNLNSAMAGINTSISTITGAQSAVTSASSALDTAKKQFTLDSAGASQQVIAAQMAQVALAQAVLDQDTIVSPIDGIVSRVTPNVGEFVQGGQINFGVINNTSYKIEAYVPEADIAKISLGNTAAVTLDAYGQNVNFPAKVSNIDPAQTILQGVPTYKVTLYFIDNDSRIRSGMTANTDILTHEADNVLTIPYRSVIKGNGSSTVRVLQSDGKTYDSVPVMTGLRGTDGMIEVISGISAGQMVVVDINK